MTKIDDRKIIECSKELLRNTKNIYLQQELENFIDDFSEYRGDTEIQDMLKVICIICEDNYNILGFGLEEIPHESVYCFRKEKTNEHFDVLLNNFNGTDKEVTVGYTASTELGFSNFDAENIQSAISKYDFNC